MQLSRSRGPPRAGNRGLWLKVKRLNREEFVVVGWTDPEGRRPGCGALLPELVAEVKFLTWTDDNLLRQVVYEGLREDKAAAQVRHPVPYPKSGQRRE
jgi:ATP-dependent DNA ligase